MIRPGFTACLVALCACAQRPTAVPSSAGQPSYAMQYAADLTAATKAIDDDQTRRKTLAADLDGRIEELKKP